MNDMTPIITPKSDQLSADDFIGGPRTYRIERVELRPGTEQPCSIFVVGEPRAWKPCKSMARVLVAAWGPDANAYPGRSVTLYRDPSVKWGGMEVGGIRVSHMSDIDGKMVLQLTATKGKRTPHIVMPLVVQQQPSTPPADPEAGRKKAEEWANGHLGAIRAATDAATLAEVQQAGSKAMTKLQRDHADLAELIGNATRTKLVEFGADYGEQGDEA